MVDVDDNVIQSLYEAAAGTVPWSVALSGLHDAMGATTTRLLVVDKSTGQLATAEQSRQTQDASTFDHLREYHRIDPHIAHVSTMVVGEVVNTRSAFPAKTYSSHPFYRDFWAAYGMRELLGAKAAEDDRHVAMVGLSRAFDLLPYSESDERLMGRYVAHLAAAFRIAKHLHRMQANAIIGYGLMQSSTRPMILLDRNCGVMAANDLARALLQREDPFQIRGSVLHCRDRDSADTLTEAMADISGTAPDGEAKRRRRALRLQQLDGTVVLCSLWDLRPEFTMGAFGPLPVALLTVADPPAGKHVDPMWLGSLFDFTPAEVRIATGMMRGEDLHQIATAQRVSLGTVRAQLKSIYTKTETHRQAQLVELLLRATAL